MAYLQSSSGEPIPGSVITALGEAAGLAIPAEDLAQLSEALRDQLAAIDRIESLDLTEVSPAVGFDPRWHD
jgi:hypothetical protein